MLYHYFHDSSGYYFVEIQHHCPRHTSKQHWCIIAILEVFKIYLQDYDWWQGIYWPFKWDYFLFPPSPTGKLKSNSITVLHLLWHMIQKKIRENRNLVASAATGRKLYMTHMSNLIAYHLIMQGWGKTIANGCNLKSENEWGGAQKCCAFNVPS